LILAYRRRNCTSLSTGIDFNVPVPTNVPKFSLVSVTDEDEVCNAVMFIKSNAAGVDKISFEFHYFIIYFILFIIMFREWLYLELY
jgi:hypothetical protein